MLPRRMQLMQPNRDSEAFQALQPKGAEPQLFKKQSRSEAGFGRYGSSQEYSPKAPGALTLHFSFQSKVAQFQLGHAAVWVMPDNTFDVLAFHPRPQAIKVSGWLRIEDQRRVIVTD
jgi:hypothetical protein